MTLPALTASTRLRLSVLGVLLLAVGAAVVVIVTTSNSGPSEDKAGYLGRVQYILPMMGWSDDEKLRLGEVACADLQSLATNGRVPFAKWLQLVKAYEDPPVTPNGFTGPYADQLLAAAGTYLCHIREY